MCVSRGSVLNTTVDAAWNLNNVDVNERRYIVHVRYFELNVRYYVNVRYCVCNVRY